MLHRIFPFQPSKTEFKLFVLYTLLIIYGSLYPFNFQIQNLLQDPYIHILVVQDPSLGDMGINLLLFMPFGFLGVRGMRSPFQPLVYCCMVILLSIPLAFGLQFLQIMVPSRVPCQMDTLMNILGCAIAASFGATHRFRFFWGKRGQEHWRSIPLLLALCWIGYLLAPFLPSLNLGRIQDSLKPLLHDPEFFHFSTLLHFTGWTVFAHVVSEHIGKPLRPRYLALIMIGISCAQLPVVGSIAPLPHHIIGALLALIFWSLIRQRFVHTKIKLLFCLLLLSVSLRGLYPFDLSESAEIDFHWTPFFGFLDGSRLINVHMLFLKVFFYASIIWFLQRTGTIFPKATLLCLIWVILIEIAQFWYIGHTPESTDPIIVLGIAVMMKIFIQEHEEQPTVYHGPERRSAGDR